MTIYNNSAVGVGVGLNHGNGVETYQELTKAEGEYYYYHNEHLGTPQKLTDADGATVWSALYSSFGEAQVIPASTIENNLRFPGQYFDTETGLHYNFFRYYDPSIGKYITPDPIGIDSDLNLYNYCFSNPINIFDEEGLSAKEYGLCVAACYLGVKTAELIAMFDTDNIPRELRRQFEKDIRKAYKKEIRNLTKRQQKEFIKKVIKKKAKKKARWFLMKKVGKKIGGKLAPNVIPGLGQVISAVLTAGDIIKVGYCATICARSNCP